MINIAHAPDFIILDWSIEKIGTTTLTREVCQKKKRKKKNRITLQEKEKKGGLTGEVGEGERGYIAPTVRGVRKKQKNIRVGSETGGTRRSGGILNTRRTPASRNEHLQLYLLLIKLNPIFLIVIENKHFHFQPQVQRPPPPFYIYTTPSTFLLFPSRTSSSLFFLSLW